MFPGQRFRSNHGVWMFPGQRFRRSRWRPFERVFTDGSSEQRYLREIIFGQRRSTRYFEITTDPLHLPRDTTWEIMTNLSGTIERSVGNTFGLRTWIEYGFKQAKDELGWADYRLTDAASIERWWELVLCAYLLVSLQAPVFAVPAGEAEGEGGALSTSEAPPPRPRRLPPPQRRRPPSSIRPGRTTPVGSIVSPICGCCSSPSSAPASCCRGCASIRSPTSRRSWPTSAPS